MVSQNPPLSQKIETNVESITYENNTHKIIFLSNVGSYYIENIKIENKYYNLAANSTICIDGMNGDLLVNSTADNINERFPDCMLPNVTYHKYNKKNRRNSETTSYLLQNWEWYPEIPGKGGMQMLENKYPIEMWNVTNDTTEYIWFVI